MAASTGTEHERDMLEKVGDGTESVDYAATIEALRQFVHELACANVEGVRAGKQLMIAQSAADELAAVARAAIDRAANALLGPGEIDRAVTASTAAGTAEDAERAAATSWAAHVERVDTLVATAAERFDIRVDGGAPRSFSP